MAGNNYSKIRAQARKGHNNRYATGGRVKPTTVINIVSPPSAGAPALGPAAAPGGIGAPSPMPPMPVPPVAGNAALGAMGAPPTLATGGRVKAGAASGVHRKQANGFKRSGKC